MIRTRPITTEPALSALGLGCSRMGSFNNPQPLADSISLIRAAMDMGVTLFDTSNIYGQGDSERVIGAALAGRRNNAFIITKAGKGFSAKMRLLRPFKPIIRPLLSRRSNGGNTSGQAITARRGDAMREDWRPAHLIRSLEGSLRRLKTDHADAMLLHSPPPAIAANPAVGDALRALKSAGKARHFGVSCDDEATLEAALGIEGLTMLELPWDVIMHSAALAPAIRSRPIIIVAREVIALQPTLPPARAVEASLAHPLVDCALVGTTRPDHLAALATASLSRDHA